MSSSAYGTDLDLSKVSSTDYDQLASKIESFYTQDSISKTQLSYAWERNMLMLDGLQWITYDGSPDSGGIWRRLQPSPQNEYIPRPVTNYMFDVYQTLKSYVLKNKPRSSVSPNTQLHKDKMAAKIGDLVLECNWERLREEYNYEYAAGCMITYGTVFKKDYWDSSYSSTVRVPRMKPVPMTDPATGEITGISEVQDMDPTTGELLYDVMPLGDVNTCIVEPFRMVLDPIAINLHEARWIMEYSIRPISWIQENYASEEPGYTGKADLVKPEKTLSSSMRRFFQLRLSSGVKTQYGYPGAAVSSGTYGTDMMIEESAIVKEYYERPSRTYPNGRLIVSANGIIVYSGDSPYAGPDQGEWHPYSECRWELVPGRFHGKSPLDNAVEIQKQINSIDSIIILTRKTMAIPQKLIPQNCGIAPGTWTGRPGQEINYRESGGAKPEIIPGAHVDEQVFIERKQRLDDIKAVTGAVDILKGDRPPGVTAASALALLYEVGTGKLFPILDRWKKFVETSQKKQLRLVARKYREPRPDFIRMLISKNRDLTEDQLRSFLGDDLYDNCNVVIEAASAIPKLKAAEHALMLELAPLGVLGLEQPANRKEFLERMGLNGFDAEYSKDVSRAEWENDLLDNLINSPDNHPVVLQTDNHQVHISTHSDRTKEPSFMSLPFQIQQAYFQHIMQHEQDQMQQQQMQMMQAASMQMATGQATQPQQQEPNPMQQQPSIHPGKGIDHKIAQQLMPDISGGKPVI